MPDLPSTPSDPFDRLVANVIALRAKGNWSTRALAEQAHVSRTAVQNLELGRSNLPLSIVDNLARALGVKTGSLFGKRPIARDETDGLIEVVLAQNLIAARKRAMLTQENLSQQSGVSRFVIAHVERQARNPKLLTVAKLAAALDLSLEALLTAPHSETGP
ncbi:MULTISPECIES: helix-turn-helix transcriptional regulator [Hydrogenophaga]|uniref:helix-turn-helix transcriptional regulator n=1 Tax=Hydrogenophaga TaxID=47420 RepID=UPI0006828952|nr:MULTISPECIES: helix-turn-helix transcriptional regulator [Hydrogenophaga]